MKKNNYSFEEFALDNNPSLLKEWDYKNNILKPSDVSRGCSKKVWWKCNKNHSWKASVYHRASGQGCPYCANRKILKGYNDLKSTNSVLASEWDYKKNGDITPEKVFSGSHKIVWWKCRNNHSWKARVDMRSRGGGCPYCSGKKVLKGFNDLTTTDPSIAAEWDHKKNKNIKPEDFSRGSSKKVWWICRYGHSWQATIGSRSSGSNCPKCSKGSGTSLNEQIIYYYVKNKYPNSINRDKKVLNGKELDIYIPELTLGIEYDDFYTHMDIEKDINKDKLCQELGVRLIRIRDKKCHVLPKNNNTTSYICNLKSETEFINILKELFHELDIDDDLKLLNDKTWIYENFMFNTYENSLKKQYPDIASEWDCVKNGKITPEMVKPSSMKKFWWTCSEGHSWNTSVDTRTNGKGCPYCSGRKVLKGYNDLKTTNFELLQEWDYEKNNDISPENYTKGSNKYVWWLCSEGHSWKASINSRVSGNGCPYCSGNKVLRGYNDLSTTYPDLIKEWDFDRNKQLKPYDFSKGSTRKVWWRCNFGHSWLASIDKRTSGRGCPYCSGKKVMKGFNDLATTHPELAKEWDYKKNGKLTPYDVTKGSHKKVWWKNDRRGSWQAVIYSR